MRTAWVAPLTSNTRLSMLKYNVLPQTFFRIYVILKFVWTIQAVPPPPPPLQKNWRYTDLKKVCWKMLNEPKITHSLTSTIINSLTFKMQILLTLSLSSSLGKLLTIRTISWNAASTFTGGSFADVSIYGTFKRSANSLPCSSLTFLWFTRSIYK